MTYWAAGQRVTGEALEDFIQRGVENVTFASAASHTRTITFPEPFSAPPIVHTNIAAAPGTIARWNSRAITVTATDFVLFVFKGDNADANVAWTDIPVHWIAVAA